VEWFRPLDVCFAPVNTLPEAFEDAQLLARGMVLTDETGRRHIAPPIRFLHEPARLNLKEPAMGEHSDELLPGPASKRAEA
jgi:crotonobetainyl-CoA:carnitine CoA-transferase CaiB-like acyl-CoA transferase